jgi:hypothetical protein
MIYYLRFVVFDFCGLPFFDPAAGPDDFLENFFFLNDDGPESVRSSSLIAFPVPFCISTKGWASTIFLRILDRC